jgi:hypothetical protein
MVVIFQALFQTQAPRDEAAKLEEQRKMIEFHVIGNSLTGAVNKQTMLWLIGNTLTPSTRLNLHFYFT